MKSLAVLTNCWRRAARSFAVGIAAWLLLVGTASSSLAAEAVKPRVIVNFGDLKSTTMRPADAKTSEVALVEGRGLEISTAADAQWPGVFFEPPGGKWNLSQFDQVETVVHNPEDAPLRVLLTVNNPGADGREHCNAASVSVPAHGQATLTVPFGMYHGDPSHVIDLTNIVSVEVLLDRPGRAHRFQIENIRAVMFDRSAMRAVLQSDYFRQLKPVLERGVNLGNALDAPKEGEWGVTLQAGYFEKIAAAGFKTVRIPVRWSAHAEAAAPYRIDPKFLERVDWAVHQSLDHGLTPIVDLHHYDALYDHPEQHRERFLALWRQMAEHYADYPPALALELLNEPRGNLTAPKWNALAAEALAVVRQSNPTREVVIGPVAWNGIGELKNLELPAGDQHIVVTVHYYSPFQFTHQGADFAGPEAMKSLGRKWTGTKAEQQAVERDFDTALAWAPCTSGQYSLVNSAPIPRPTSNRAHRWTRFIVEQAAERKMGTAYWEFCSGFGIYDSQRNQWLEPLRNALLSSTAAK